MYPHPDAYFYDLTASVLLSYNVIIVFIWRGLSIVLYKKAPICFRIGAFSMTWRLVRLEVAHAAHTRVRHRRSPTRWDLFTEADDPALAAALIVFGLGQ